jgi:hypothetical protein
MFQTTGKFIEGFAELEITDGPYRGIKFYYTKVSLTENAEKTEGILHFEFNLTEGSDRIQDHGEFQNLLGRILNTIMLKMMEAPDGKRDLIYHGGINDAANDASSNT